MTCGGPNRLTVFSSQVKARLDWKGNQKSAAHALPARRGCCLGMLTDSERALHAWVDHLLRRRAAALAPAERAPRPPAEQRQRHEQGHPRENVHHQPINMRWIVGIRVGPGEARGVARKRGGLGVLVRLRACAERGAEIEAEIEAEIGGDGGADRDSDREIAGRSRRVGFGLGAAMPLAWPRRTDRSTLGCVSASRLGPELQR